MVILLAQVGRGLMGGGVNSDDSDIEHLALEACNMSSDFLFLLSDVDTLILESGESTGSS